MTHRPHRERHDGSSSFQNLRESLLHNRRGVEQAVLRNKRFRVACALSFFLHFSLFVTATWVPSKPRYRFFGSGTAVSLVGADQIPGGSARGKSGDRPEPLREAERSAEKAAKKTAEKPKPKAPPVEKAAEKVRKIPKPAPEKKPPEKKVAKKVEKKIPKKTPKKKVQEAAPKKPERALKRKKKEKAPDPKRLARLEAIRKRRERARRWRERYQRQAKADIPPKKAEPVPADWSPARKAPENPSRDVAKRNPSRAGYPGEGGGDGQGGGSIGGGGGTERTDLDRYYGRLAERIRGYWTIPLTLTGIENLRTTITVDVGRDGTIRNLQIEGSSGNRFYDEAALRAVAKAANPSFPPPPNNVRESWLLLGFRFCGRNFCKG